MLKKYFTDTFNFVIDGDRVVNIFWRATNSPKILYLQHVIISCGANNINKDSPFDITECLIELDKYFEERSQNVKIVISSILPLGECWSVNRIIISETNNILADKCSLSTSTILLTINMAEPWKVECLTLIFILKIMST